MRAFHPSSRRLAPHGAASPNAQFRVRRFSTPAGSTARPTCKWPACLHPSVSGTPRGGDSRPPHRVRSSGGLARFLARLPRASAKGGESVTDAKEAAAQGASTLRGAQRESEEEHAARPLRRPRDAMRAADKAAWNQRCSEAAKTRARSPSH